MSDDGKTQIRYPSDDPEELMRLREEALREYDEFAKEMEVYWKEHPEQAKITNDLLNNLQRR